MARRVGRPSKPFNPLGYTLDENKIMYELIKKVDKHNPSFTEISLLKLKLRHNIAESKRLAINYNKAKIRLFGK